MRILFAGTPALAVPSLSTTARVSQLVGVLTSTDQPAGRGRGLTPSPVKEAALTLGVPVLQPAKLDAEALEAVKALRPDMLVVAAYGKIFRPAFLDLFPLGGINLHPSLLPRHRGPSPITAAILAGDAETGVTIQRIAQKFDTGDVLLQERWPLDGSETTATLSEALGAAGAALLGRVLEDCAAGRPPEPRRQVEADATYCATLRKEDGLVSWSEPAVVLERKVRAYDPWPRCLTTLGGETLLLLKSHVYPGTLASAAGRAAPGGIIAADKGHGILVQTGDGVLAVERLQQQFKKPMDWRSFLNGHPAIVGARLGT